MKTLEKIKKLLRLANDKAASPAEAANALQRALQMANAAGLNLSDIDLENEHHAGLTHDSVKVAALGDAERLAMHLVCDFFSVDHLMSQRSKKIDFIGTADAVQLARYSHTFLVRAARKSWKENGDRRHKRYAFLRGFFFAIERQLKAAFPAPKSEALILSTKAYITNVILGGADFKTTKPKPKKLASGSFHNGIVAGNKTTILNPLKDSSRTLT